MRVWRAVGALAVGWAAAMACTAVAAGAANAATITPTVALSPASGVAASTQNLGVDIRFGYSGRSDTVKDMTLALPAGLLANASDQRRQVHHQHIPGRGLSGRYRFDTATATVLKLLPVTETLSAEFDLVAPPGPGDLPGCRFWPRTRRTPVPDSNPSARRPRSPSGWRTPA